MLRKLGKFFLLVSILLIFLFVASDVGGTPDYTVFLGGFLTLAFAILLLRRPRDSNEEKPRFRLIRKLGNRNEEEDS